MPAVVVVNRPGVSLFSGSDLFGTFAAPFRFDPVGVTSQPITTPGLISTGNSSTTPLGANAAFTGSWEEITNYAGVTISAWADQASAFQGFRFQWSSDGVIMERQEVSTVPSGSGRGISIAPRSRYFRILYENGSIAQTTFRLSTTLHTVSPGIVTRAISGSISEDSFVQLVKAVVAGKNTSGIYVDASFDDEGRLIVSPSVTQGTTKGFSDGKISLSTTTITSVYATTYTEQLTNAKRSISSNNANDTSAAGTGARTVTINYYDQNLNGPYSETLTLTGTTAVSTSGSNICFIENMRVVTVGSNASNVGIISLYAATGALGGAVWSIAAADNKTFGAHHYVASGSTAFITGFLLGIKGADTTSGFLRVKDPTLSGSAEIQASDTQRAPSAGQSFRAYGTPVSIPSPAKITGFVAPDSSSTRVYYVSFDYYEE